MLRGRHRRAPLLAALLLAAAPAWAGGHGDPVAPVVLSLALILLFAKLGGDAAVRLGQPAVLGELLAGIALGNLPLLGVTFFVPMETDASLDLLARLGVIVLLFEVGLESTVGQMMAVGRSAAAVAVLGVVTPFALGWAVSAWLLPDAERLVHVFIGATLTATSVGITARVLQDLQRSDTPEARIILGAAVLDDVLGLMILAVVAGLVASAEAGTTLTAGELAAPLLKAVVFLVSALVLGRRVSRRLFKVASLLQVRGVLLAVALAFCFALSWAADAIGLAPIVGAFAAGLVLEDTHYASLASKEQHALESLIHPIAAFLVPVFFVLMGLRTKLAAFTAPGVLGLAAALVVVAVAGKVVGGLGARGPGLDRLSVGLGMVPRGEVGLIFASLGAGLVLHGQKVIDGSAYAAVVLVVVVTTMVTPPALKWSLARAARRR